MKKMAALFVLLLTTSVTLASTTDCQNLYVGRVLVRNGQGLVGAMFLNSPGDSSGSYWVLFSNWSADDKKAALAILTSAKLAGHRVIVATGEPDGCGIQTGQSVATDVSLATNP